MDRQVESNIEGAIDRIKGFRNATDLTGFIEAELSTSLSEAMTGGT